MRWLNCDSTTNPRPPLPNPLPPHSCDAAVLPPPPDKRTRTQQNPETSQQCLLTLVLAGLTVFAQQHVHSSALRDKKAQTCSPHLLDLAHHLIRLPPPPSGEERLTQTSPKLQTTALCLQFHLKMQLVRTFIRVLKKLRERKKDAKKLTDAHHRRTSTHLTQELVIIAFTEQQGPLEPLHTKPPKTFSTYPLPIPNDDFPVAQNA